MRQVQVRLISKPVLPKQLTRQLGTLTERAEMQASAQPWAANDQDAGRPEAAAAQGKWKTPKKAFPSFFR
jgi:hypothetical protein